MSSDNNDNDSGFVARAIKLPSAKVNFSYICQLCFVKTKPNDGHFHPAKKNQDKIKKQRQQQRESYLRMRLRKKMLKLC